MANPHWPLFDLRIVTPRLELRYPTDDDLFALAGILAEGIHDPATMPFARRGHARSHPSSNAMRLRFWWSHRASLVPEAWSIPFAVFERGEVVGVQEVGAKEFATTRTVTTGSWLVQRAHGRGIGKEMRAAVLHLAFAWIARGRGIHRRVRGQSRVTRCDAVARLRTERRAPLCPRRKAGARSSRSR